jgi:hypothetical protein
MRLVTALALLLPVATLPAQWQRGDGLDVVRRAASERSRRDAAGSLARWQATAEGTVRFAAVMRHGETPIERVIRVDELRVEVYGEAPSRSKQVIVAWRDSTLQPTSIVYHRDHLGIVTQDFGDQIRLGEGDEVRDVPHPLSPRGLEHYRFRLGDTLVLGGPAGSLRAVAIEVRPADAEGPGAVGVLYLDVDRAALVRFDFTFTGASYRDPSVSAIAVRLENALHEGSWWLPWRQSVTIARAVPWLALPLETVIRAIWELDDYRLGVVHPPDRFAGEAIAGLRAPGGGSWPAPMRIDLEAAANEAAALEAITAQAGQLLSQRLLEGLPGVRFGVGQGLSHLVRVNRVQGPTLGAGMRWLSRAGVALELQAAVGTSDRRLSGGAAVSGVWRGLGWALRAERAVESSEWQPRRSGLVNSLATTLTGDDAGDWYQVDRVAGELRVARVVLGGARERVTSRTSSFEALDGTVRDNPPLGSDPAWRWWLRHDGRTRTGRGWMVTGEAGRVESWWWRGVATAGCLLPAEMRCDVAVGLSGGGVPPHRAFVLGGVGSVPTAAARSVAGRRFLRAEVSRSFGLTLPAPRLGRAGFHPRSAVAPFAGLAVAGGPARPDLAAIDGLVPFVGLRLELWGPALRLEGAWNPRRGHLSLGLDAHPDWWPLL